MWNNKKKLIILDNEHIIHQTWIQSGKSAVSHPAHQNGNVFQLPKAKTQFLLVTRHQQSTTFNGYIVCMCTTVKVKPSTSEPGSNYMIHVYTEIVVAEGWQECGCIDKTRIGSDLIMDWITDGIMDGKKIFLKNKKIKLLLK